MLTTVCLAINHSQIFNLSYYFILFFFIYKIYPYNKSTSTCISLTWRCCRCGSSQNGAWLSTQWALKVRLFEFLVYFYSHLVSLKLAWAQWDHRNTPQPNVSRLHWFLENFPTKMNGGGLMQNFFLCLGASCLLLFSCSATILYDNCDPDGHYTCFFFSLKLLKKFLFLYNET